MEWASGLKELILSKNNIGDTGLAVFASGSWPCLTKLLLQQNKLTHKGIRQLQKTSLPSLQILNLYLNRLDNAGIRMLIKCNWKQLVSLKIKCVKMGVAGLHELVLGDWAYLRWLEISKNYLEWGERSLVNLLPGNWPKLTNLITQRIVKQSKLDPQIAYIFRSEIQYELFERVPIYELRDYSIRKDS